MLKLTAYFLNSIFLMAAKLLDMAVNVVSCAPSGENLEVTYGSSKNCWER